MILEAKDETTTENLDKLVNIDIICFKVKVLVKSVSLGLSDLHGAAALRHRSRGCRRRVGVLWLGTRAGEAGSI